MSKRKENSSSSTHLTRQLDIVPILVSALLGAIFEIVLEKILTKSYQRGLHKKIGHSIMKLKLFIYDANYLCRSSDIDWSRVSYLPTPETVTTYTATRIFRNFIINKRNYETKTRVVKCMYFL